MDIDASKKPAKPPVVQGLTFRSGAVARMAHMPVATLRIWEQRYQAVRPTTAPSGHRLYSPADVERVLLLRQLTQQGQAIGSIAGLQAAELQEVANRHAGALSDAVPRPVQATAALRLIVVGLALAKRLQRPAVTRCLAHPAQVVAVFGSLAEAARAGSGTRIDVLIWQASGLQTMVPPELSSAQAAWRARQVAVVYRFAGAAAKEAFAHTGALLVREPTEDDALGHWLASLERVVAAAIAALDPPVPSQVTSSGLPKGAAARRRFDDAALTAIMESPPSLACECPRHVAELLLQIANFEDYSAGCANRSPADAQLHAYLQRVAGASRALFESALETVARHEGLVLR